MNVILREIEYVKECLLKENPPQDKQTRKLIIQYMIEEHKRIDKILPSVKQYFEKNSELLNEDEQLKLKKWIIRIRKNNLNLINIDTINVYEDELKFISEFNNEKLEMLAFTLLVHSKYNKIKYNKEGFFIFDRNQAFNDSLIKVRSSEKSILLHQLKELKFIKIPKKVDSTSIEILIDEKKGKSILQIDALDNNFVYQYLNWKKGGGYKTCEDCNKWFKLRSSTHKRCKTCSILFIQKYDRERKSNK